MWIALIALVTHPVHASLSEVQWNAQTGRVEVSLRLAPSDAEFILQRSQSAKSLSAKSLSAKPPSAKSRPAESPSAASQPANPQPGARSGPDADSSIETSAIALDYLNRRFRISDWDRSVDRSRPRPSQYRWVGEELKNGYVWWHFEIVPADQMPPKQWTVTLLLDREPNYQHRMVVLGLGRPVALDFSSSITRLSSDFWKR